jgi:hypothetical protein
LKHERKLNSTTDGLDHDTGDLVGASIGSGAAVLEVAVTLLGTRPRNTDGGTTVSDTVTERLNVAGLVLAGKTKAVVVTVDSDVLLVALSEPVNGLVDVLHTTLFTHLLGREVGVQARAVPITSDGLGVEGNLDTKVLSNTVEEVTSHPEVVTHLNALARTDLELPLGRQDLGIDTRDLDTGVHASTVVGLDNVTAVDLAGTNTTVVRTLRTGETTLGPSIGSTKLIEESVLLLKAEPRNVLLVGLHELVAFMSAVELVRGAIGVPALTEDEDVVAPAERIWEDSNGAEVDIRVLTGSLSGRRTVEVPLGELVNRSSLLVESLSFASDTIGTINPNVLCLDAALLVEGQILLQSSSVGGVFGRHFLRGVL